MTGISAGEGSMPETRAVPRPTVVPVRHLACRQLRGWCQQHIVVGEYSVERIRVALTHRRRLPILLRRGLCTQAAPTAAKHAVDHVEAIPEVVPDLPGRFDRGTQVAEVLRCLANSGNHARALLQRIG